MAQFENPPIRCEAFHQLSALQPQHCYNCAMRKGYPWYIFGDECCENFQEIFENGQRHLK